MKDMMSEQLNEEKHKLIEKTRKVCSIRTDEFGLKAKTDYLG